jgi:hypothetical protein
MLIKRCHSMDSVDQKIMVFVNGGGSGDCDGSGGCGGSASASVAGGGSDERGDGGHPSLYVLPKVPKSLLRRSCF